MRRILVWLLLLTLTPLSAEESDIVFRPGKSLGRAVLGQNPDKVLEAFADWTYSVDKMTIGDSYYFPETEPADFICSFNTDRELREITIQSKSIRMRKSPQIGPGCSQEELRRKFGVPSTNTLEDEKFGGYWDYEHLGICFHFDGSSRNTPRYGVGNVDGISIYLPGQSRFKR